MKFFKNYIILVFLFYILVATIDASEKVAIIVVGDDSFAARGVPEALQKQAIRAYVQLGYEVLLVGGTQTDSTPISRDEIFLALKKVKGAKDIRLDFIGHGSLVSGPKDTSETITIRPERRAGLKNPENKNNPNLLWSVSDVSLDSDFSELSAPLGIKSSKGALSSKEIKDLLSDFKKTNPDSNVTLNLLNCHSGALAQYLRKESNVIVFANAPTTETSLTTLNSDAEKSASALKNYYDHLIGDKGNESLINTRMLSNKEYMESDLITPFSPGLHVYTTGRSPITESILGWCEENKKINTSKTTQINSQRKLLFDQAESEILSIANIYEQSVNSKEINKFTTDYFDQKINCTPPNSLSYKDKAQFCYNNCLKQIKLKNDDNQRKSLKIISNFLGSLMQKIKTVEKSIFEKNLRKKLNEIIGDAEKKKYPHFRFGQIGEMASTENINIDEKLKSMSEYVSNAIDACKDGDINEAPCSKFEKGAKQIYFLVNDMAQYNEYNMGNCGYDDENPDCLIKLGQKLGPKDLKTYWSYRSKNKKLNCEEMQYPEISRILNNINLDKKCLAQFKEYAPEDEWENLVRIYTLGIRPARGWSDIKTINESTDCNPNKQNLDIIPKKFEIMINQLKEKVTPMDEI
jgi:hypothetical protein